MACPGSRKKAGAAKVAMLAGSFSKELHLGGGNKRTLQPNEPDSGETLMEAWKRQSGKLLESPKGRKFSAGS